MKCPECGAWNQAFLPKCTRCGADLTSNVPQTADWEADMHKKKPSLKITSYDQKDTMEAVPEPPHPAQDDKPYDPEYLDNAALTDEMEERGIVAAKDGSKPRKCLITREEWEEMKKATEGMT